MVLLSQQLSLRIGDYYAIGVSHYDSLSIEAAPLLNIGLNSLPVASLKVVAAKLEAHPAEACLLNSLPVLTDFTSGSLADKEVYRAHCNQYYESEG